MNGKVTRVIFERRAAKPRGASSSLSLTLPPTLLAARGSRLEYRTRFLAAPPAGILEQKRDCSPSSGEFFLWSKFVMQNSENGGH